MARFTAGLGALLVLLTMAACGGGGASGTGGRSSASSGSGGAGGAGTGGAGACSDASQCPGSDTDCETRTCAKGQCGISFVAKGTPIAAQIEGDCETIVCDGSGAHALVPDDADVLDDGNPCTADTCSAGTPVNTPLAAGSPCSEADGGGKVCDAGAMCVGCLAPGDCASGLCQEEQCVPVSCGDGVKDGTETDIDCGGDCGPCPDGDGCALPGDCQSGVCLGAPLLCQTPTCDDGVKNGGETGADCGGPTCAPCGPGLGCASDADCIGGDCSGAVCLPTCTDHVEDGGETGVDCGGPTCAKCAAGGGCSGPGDCAGGVCSGGVCQAPGCGDGVKNGSETGVDCGGGACAPCGTGQGCVVPADCLSRVCLGHVCQAATCADHVQNGGETGIDCGGPACPKCLIGGGCASGADCETGVCSGGTCQQPECGDGVVNGAEQCDDGNHASGDGCSSTCQIEPGYACAGNPSVCTPICGDGLVTGDEQCDDGNDLGGDGCSATCTIELGYSCAGAPSVCTAGCGDGVVGGSEQCDDGNNMSGDGCSASCTVEHGYTCAGAPSVCHTTCGDGIVAGAEQCDDGNLMSGDGCSATCTTEVGYTCAGSPSLCQTVCGDGIVAGAEQCDDGNLMNGDGCSATCTSEPGYTCVGAPSVCHTTCGDGIKAGNEQCDDGNLANGDCCSATCTIEAGCEIEPNDTFATANDFAALSLSGRINGFIQPAGERDLYVIDVPVGSTGTLTAETVDNFLGVTCASDLLDTVVTVYDTGEELLVTDDDAGGNKCSEAVATTLPPGAYYVEVKAASAAATFAYTLSVALALAPCGDGILQPGEQCDDGNHVNGDGCSSACRLEPHPEVEPNDTCAMAGAPYTLPPSVLVSGSIDPANDVDWYAFTIAYYADVRLETFDASGPGNCEIDVDTLIQLFGSDCVTPVSAPQDQGGINNCSELDPVVDPSVQRLPPGTYYVRVSSPFGGITFDYTLQMTPLSDCGDGIIEGSEQCDGGAHCTPSCTLIVGCGDGIRQPGEQCDDGNNVSGDGCSATCMWETIAEVEPNGTTAQANAAGIVISGYTNLTGAISPAGDADLFKLVAAAPATIRFEVFDPSGYDCIAGINAAMTLKLLDSNGALLKQDTPAGDVTASGIGLYCPALVANVTAGTYYVEVQGKAAGTTIASYFLQVEFETNAGSEVEPNDAQAMATADPGADTAIAGTHPTLDDVDFYAITIPPGVARSIRAEVIEGDAGKACDLHQMDPLLTLYDANGTLLASDDDSGRGYCSAIDGTGTGSGVGYYPGAHDLAPGTYYLAVQASEGASAMTGVFDYELAVTVRQ